MKINSINKRLVASLLGGIILTTPLSLASCKSFSYITESDGKTHLDDEKMYEYNDVKNLYIIVLKINDQEIIYLTDLIYIDDLMLEYYDVFTDQKVYYDDISDKLEGVELVSTDKIEKYLISYKMLNEEYSKKDIELLFDKIKHDYYEENNKVLVKK